MNRMMNKFIYVFREEDRDVLIEKGYALLTSDAKQHLYVFENERRSDAQALREIIDGQFLMSGTLTFRAIQRAGSC